MGRDAGMRIVGTIRSLELHTLASKFQNVPTREVAKLELDIERATDDDDNDLDVENLTGLHFQGPAELVPLYAVGERVLITTPASAGMHIASIKRAPVS